MLSTAHLFSEEPGEMPAAFPFPLSFLSFPPPQAVVVVFLFLFPTPFSTAPIQPFIHSLGSSYNNIMVFHEYGCSYLFLFPLFSGFGH